MQGFSTAAVMENGTGKTTIVDAILAIIARDDKLITNTKDKMPPKSAGTWGHVRIELMIPMPTSPGQATLPGDDIVGDGLNTWVFGICGYYKDKHYFYCYRGTLEETSPAKVESHQTTFYPNEVFKAKLTDAAKSEWKVSKDTWIERISKHISRQQALQMITFQKGGAGDESRPLFPLKRVVGQKYDETFFYQFIAPELMSGIMVVDDGTDVRFEDVLNRSANRIVAAQENVNRDERDINRKRLAISDMHGMLREADRVVNAQNSVVQARQEIANVTTAVDYLEQANLPGTPQMVLTGDPQIDSLVQNMAIVPGRGLMLKDKGFAQFLKKQVEHINEKAEELNTKEHINNTLPFKAEQLIEITPDVKQLSPQRGGRRYRWKCYELDACTEFVENCSNQYFNLLPDNASGKQSLIDSLERAFAHASMYVDTSPYRKITRQLISVIGEKKQAIKKLEAEKDSAREKIRSKQQILFEIKHLENAYNTLKTNGILIGKETPEDAKNRIRAQINDLEQQVRDLIEQRGNYDGNKRQYDLLIDEYGLGANPKTIELDLLKKQQAANESKNRLDQELKSNREQRDITDAELQQAQGRILEYRPLVSMLENGAKASETLIATFSDCATPDEIRQYVAGIRTQIVQEITDLKQKQSDLQQEIEQQRIALNKQLDTLSNEQTDARAQLKALDQVVGSLRNEAAATGKMIHDIRQQQGKSKKELTQATANLKQLQDREKKLQIQAGYIEAFEKAHPGMTPDTFIKQSKEALAALQEESKQLNELMSSLQEEEQALSKKKVAPEATAKKAWELVQGDARNLWEVIMSDASKERQQSLLDRMSALIFAPVVKNVIEAQTLAAQFEKKQIPLPVFIEGPLVESLVGDDLGLVKALPEYRSAQVDFLLNPNKIKKRISDIQSELDSLAKRQVEAAEESKPYQDVSDVMQAATLANKALLADVPSQSLRCKEEVVQLELRVEGLNTTINDATDKIDEYSKIKQQKEEKATSKEQSLPTLDQKVQALTAQIAKIRLDRDDLSTLYKQNQRIELEDAHDKAEERLLKHDDKYGQNSAYAKEIDSFSLYVSEGGARRLEIERETLKKATNDESRLTQEKKGLRKTRTTLREKIDTVSKELFDLEKSIARFDFPALIQFHETGGLKEYEKIQAEINKRDQEKEDLGTLLNSYNFGDAQTFVQRKEEQIHLKEEVETIQGQREAVIENITEAKETIDANSERLIKIRQEEKSFDEQLAQLLPLLRKAPTIDDNDFKANKENHLLQQIASYVETIDEIFIDLSDITGEPARLVHEIKENLREAGLIDLAKNLQNGIKKVKRAKDDFEHVMELTLPSLRDKFTEIEINEISKTREDPRKLKEKVSLYERILRRKEDEMSAHKEIVEKEKEHFIVRMSNIASEAEGNLKTFQRVCSKHKDATFDVSAEIATTEKISDAMEAIIELAKNTLKKQRESGGKTSSKALDAACFGSNDSEQRTLSAKVLYETIFQEPSIEVKHPDIRQGNFMKFSRGDKKISKGQKAALDLMMLVRLAEFAKIKVLANMSAGNRKREAGLKQTFIIIDGLFSSLSKQSLIKGALAALEACKGQFQLIGFIHNLRYINDYRIFPSYIVGRKVEGRSGVSGDAIGESWVEVDDPNDPNYNLPVGGSKIGQVGVFNSTIIATEGNNVTGSP